MIRVIFRYLSEGLKQFRAITRVFLADAQLILTDEPTGNIDSKGSNEVMLIV